MTATVDRQALPLTGLLGMTYNGLSAVIFERVVVSGSDDIRPSHGSVFEQLTLEDGLRLKDLAARAHMTPQSMGELVDELEALGYIERRPDPNDRRAKRICLTRKGRRNTRRGWEIVTELENELEVMLGSRRLRSLRATLLEILGSPPLS